ncbi:MAG: carboxymuconolactone decarboxylase family protein [Salinimicrobium sp.]
MGTSIPFSTTGNTPFEKLLGHNVEILQKWNELENALFETSCLDEHLLEQVRRSLAFGNGCEYCMAKAGKPNFDQNDKCITAATAFAEAFAVDHKSISEPHFDYLREYFSEKEISALCAFISFLTASQRFCRIMNMTAEL